jgi:hypothetical protein
MKGLIPSRLFNICTLFKFVFLFEGYNILLLFLSGEKKLLISFMEELKLPLYR